MKEDLNWEIWCSLGYSLTRKLPWLSGGILSFPQSSSWENRNYNLRVKLPSSHWFIRCSMSISLRESLVTNIASSDTPPSIIRVNSWWNQLQFLMGQWCAETVSLWLKFWCSGSICLLKLLCGRTMIRWCNNSLILILEVKDHFMREVMLGAIWARRVLGILNKETTVEWVN